MTYSSAELAANRNVSAEVLAWRAWRRSMKVSIPEAAAMAGVDSFWLQRCETGKVKCGRRVLGKLKALMERWKDHAPP